MKYGRREFIERVMVSAAIYGIQPWTWAQWLHGHTSQRAVDAMRSWDEVGEAVAATMPISNTIIAPTKLGEATFAGTSRGVNFGDAVWNVTEDMTATWLRPRNMTTSMLRAQVTSPGSVSSAYRFDWVINQTGLSIRQLDLPVRLISKSANASIAVNMLLAETAAFSNYYAYNSSSVVFAATPIVDRSRYVTALRHLPSAVIGSPSITNTMNRLRVQITVNAGEMVDIVIGPPLINAYTKSMVSFSFDDTNLNDYTYAYLYMKDRGVKGSSCVNSTFGTLPRTTMKEMVDSGMWSIHNHTAQHLNLTTLSSQQVETEVLNCRDFIANGGMTKGQLFIPPFGATNDTAEERIHQVYKYTVLAGGAHFGFRTFDGMPDDIYIERTNADSAVSLATLLDRLDNAIAYGNTINFYGHNPNPSPTQGGHTDSDDLHALVDIVARYNQSKILDSVTLEESVQRLEGGRYVRA